MALDTVQDYLTETRRLLQDLTVPYRYSDTEIVDALNIAILEARRTRPDLFMVQARTFTVPAYSSGSLGTSVAIDYQYRPAFIYYLVGRMSLRDDETEEDQRATVLMNKFVAQLLTVQS